MPGNGNIVAAGTLNMRSSSNASSNGVFQVFGIPTNSNLAALVGSNYDPQDGIVRFTACNVPALPLSLTFFRGRALYASAITPAVTNLSTTTLTPNFSGSTGTYYVAIGTAVGGTGAQTTVWKALVDGTTALTLAPSLTNGTTYYISGYGSNANGTRTLAVSNTTAFVPLAAPTISANTISNTTFTVTAALPSGATSNVYALYTQAGTFQSSNTTGTFTGLSSNTQYYVTVQAKTAYTASALATSASVWSLAPPTLTGFAVSADRTFVTINLGNYAGTQVTRYTVSNIGGLSSNKPLATAATWSRSSSTTATTFLSNTFVSYSVAYTAANSIYYASSIVNFIVVDAGATASITLPAASFTYQLTGGAGGTGVVSGAAGGYGSTMTGSSTLSTGDTLLMYAGRNGSNGSGTTDTGTVNSGDGTKGGNGGYGGGTTAYSGVAGGSAGGGGSASQIMCIATNYIVCAGGGGGGGGGGTEGGKGGGGGVTVVSGSIAIGGQGESYSGFLYDSNNGGGYYGGYGGGLASGGSSGSALNGNYAAGSEGNGTGFPLSILSSVTGKGGNGNHYFGTTSGGGGGGWGGGGGGVARNYAGSHDSGGGGGGGSYAHDASATFTQFAAVPVIGLVCYS